MTVARFVAVMLLAAAANATAQTVGLATSAIERHRSVSLHKWRFDRVRTEEGVTTRERCLGEGFRQARCRLMAVDGDKPDEAALQAYAKDTTQPVTTDLPNLDPKEWIDVETLAITEREGASVSFGFAAAADSPKEYEKSGRSRGTAIVDREEGALVSMHIANTEPFKAAIGVKISELAVEMGFVTIDDTVFLGEITMRVRARALGVKNIAQDTRVIFQNFTAP